MRMMRARAKLHTGLVALLLGTGAAWEARADPIVHNMGYSTSGAVSSTGVTGAGAVSFNGINQGALDVPSTFSLGSFQVAALPAGSSVTYANTPFTISFLSNDTVPLTISGVLNGTVDGSDSSLKATFQTVDAGTPSFVPGPGSAESAATLSLGGLTQPLSVSMPFSSVYLEPSGVKGDITPLSAQIQVAGSVPEPATGALLLTALAGLALRHRRRAGVARDC